MANPIKFSFKSEIYSLILTLVTILSGFYFYQNFPDIVATHWGFSGQVDGYSPKLMGAFIGPVMLTLIYLSFYIFPCLDPKKDRYQDFAPAYHLFKNLIVTMFFIITMASGFYNLGYPVSINIIVPTIIGLMMIILGNYMGKLKRNYFVGVKTPWALASENVWNKTQRLGGWTFIIFGLLIMITPFLGHFFGAIAFILGILLVIFGNFIYSYHEYRKELESKKK